MREKEGWKVRGGGGRRKAAREFKGTGTFPAELNMVVHALEVKVRRSIITCKAEQM